jgi:hypothetical protein
LRTARLHSLTAEVGVGRLSESLLRIMTKRFQAETKTHETDLRHLRAERRAEDNNLAALKRKVRDKLTSAQPTLFAAHADGRVNAA